MKIFVTLINNKQDKFDDVSSYVHKGIEFCEKYEDFCKKRCTIENNYAKHLRKLIETSVKKAEKNLNYLLNYGAKSTIHSFGFSDLVETKNFLFDRYKDLFNLILKSLIKLISLIN